MSVTWPRVQFDYRDTRVLVTGGSNGIGLSIAHAYLAAGADVTITGTRASTADYEHDLSGFRYLPLKVTDNANIAAVAEAVPALDIFINNAGASFSGLNKSEFDPDAFEQTIRINLTSGYRLAALLKDKLAASALQGGASMISIGSMTTFFGNPIVPGYGAAKAALSQLAKTLAMEWAPQVRVNVVAAGLTRSNMTSAFIGNEEAVAPHIARSAIKRVVEPEEIAAAVLFLTSPAASMITGQTLAVDGGFTITG